MATIKTATIKAWLPRHSSIKAAHAADADSVALVDQCGFSNLDMSTEGWVHIGEAQIVVTLRRTDELTSDHIAALRNEQAQLVAQATRVEQQIQNLLAIGHSEAA